jgi:probable addiction module antidote protein
MNKEGIDKFRKFEDFLQERLGSVEYAQVFINVALEEYEKDGDTKAFLLAIRDVAEAHGGLSKLAKKAKLNRQNLYSALSARGNPRLRTIDTILHALGLRLSVEQCN